jgi:hypothetical protein
MQSTVCIAEDRETCEPCLKLLLLSLTAHFPGTAVSLFYPPANDRFVTWLGKCPQVCFQPKRLKNNYGWNIKPQAIIDLLRRGFDEVTWIDSDIIVTRNPSFSRLNKDTLVTTENTLVVERPDPNALRARLWGFPVGRVLPFSLNSCVLRATKDHLPLLDRWWELLQSDAYQDVQRRAWRHRPVHMLGDQDVLTALLTSEEFAAIPVCILRRGKDIIQFDGINGYTVAERIRNLLGEHPAFIHSCAGKPWSERWRLESPDGLREYIKKVYLDLSPYTSSAIHFRKELEADTEWMDTHYVLSRLLRGLGCGCPALVGLPMAIFGDLARVVNYVRKHLKRTYLA